MTTSPTLPLEPFQEISMDYARLRAEGIRSIARLGGEQWTDHNPHDPGITLLEQLCYAITDLGYRTSFPIADLLAGDQAGLHPAEAILTGNPVTADDLRRLALDLDGIGNAWVEPVEQAELAFFYHAASRELRLRSDPADPDTTPVRLRGLQRIVLQNTDALAGEQALSSVAKRLHAARGLGGDLQFALLGAYPVTITAEIELADGVTDPRGLLVKISHCLQDYLAPAAAFVSRAEALADGRPLDEVFEGPLLEHGFVARLPDPRRVIYASDLIHAILDLPATRAVRSLALQGPGAGLQNWALDVPPGQVAVLAPDSRLVLYRRGLPLLTGSPPAPRGPHRPALVERAETTSLRARDLTRHRSIQYQLPAAYGIGPLGLPDSASAERKAQARQLAAYLLIFDQLFANALAQLANAHRLFSPAESDPRTYFTAPVEDQALRLAELLIDDPAAHRAWLEAAVETGNPLERRQRFLTHLLARFGEELGEHAFATTAELGPAEEALVAARRAFLNAYPQLSGARGSGSNILESEPLPGGFEARLRHKLGLRDDQRLTVVEHILLRPLAEDARQAVEEGEPEVVLLADVGNADPWSLQVSIVLDEPRPADPAFENFVAETLLAEIPAHLAPHLIWLGADDGVDDAAAFAAAWRAFRSAHGAYRAAQLGLGQVPDAIQLRARGARDRVIDLLYVSTRPEPQAARFGRTYPLRDLPLPAQLVVAPGARASIPLTFSQEGVRYELRYADGSGAPVLDEGEPIIANGTGGAVQVRVPPVEADVTYRILAVKLEGAEDPEQRRESWLRGTVRVVEGIDPRLLALIRLPLLDPNIHDPQPADARIGAFGIEAEVEVQSSQEGVSYELIADAADLSDPARDQVLSAAPVVGTSGTIVLRSKPIFQDVDLRIRGKRTTGDAEHPVIRTNVLNGILPLRVRANPDLAVELEQPIVDYDADTVLEVAATQPSASYQVFAAPVRDRHFVFFEPGSGASTIDIAGDDRTVYIKRPPAADTWQDLPGFAPLGDAASGTGGTLAFGVGAASGADEYLLVRASKLHEKGPLGSGSERLASAVQLKGAFARLVRPNPAQPLSLQVTIVNGATTGPVLVEAGQPGVFYELFTEGQPEPLGLPAYFHQRDDESAPANKGIDQLRVEVDLVLTRDPEIPPDNRRLAAPPPPLLDLPALPAETVLRVLARKAVSGLGAELSRTALLADVPSLRVEPAAVAVGASAEIVIDASRSDELYALKRAARGETVGAIIPGNGGRITLPTGALSERTTFTLSVTRQGPATLSVERQVSIVVDVE